MDCNWETKQQARIEWLKAMNQPTSFECRWIGPVCAEVSDTQQAHSGDVQLPILQLPKASLDD